jgi:hypothetical protein
VKQEDTTEPVGRPSTSTAAKSSAERRTELFSQGSEATKTAVRRYYTLMLPTLVDVYAASVSVSVRSRAVQGMLKIVNFCDAEDLSRIMTVSTPGSMQRTNIFTHFVTARADVAILSFNSCFPGPIHACC